MAERGAPTVKLLSPAALLIRQCAAPAVFSLRHNCNDTTRSYKKLFLLTVRDRVAVEVSNRPLPSVFWVGGGDIPYLRLLGSDYPHADL